MEGFDSLGGLGGDGDGVCGEIPCEGLIDFVDDGDFSG